MDQWINERVSNAQTSIPPPAAHAADDVLKWEKYLENAAESPEADFDSEAADIY